MNLYLYTWNPKRWNWKDLPYAMYCVNNDKPYDIRWSCGNTKRIKVGDLFFLMRLGVESKGIIGCGYVISKPYEQPHWDQKQKALGQTALYTDLLFEVLYEKSIFPLEYLKSKSAGYNWTPQSGGTAIKDSIASELLIHIQSDIRFKFSQKSEQDINVYVEGMEKIISHRTYDRSSLARQACIEHHGYNCSVCDFNFGAEFGKLGESYIEIHHLNPIADIGEEYEIDPIKDLRPVCANCHRMLHKERPPLSIEELKTRRKEKWRGPLSLTCESRPG